MREPKRWKDGGDTAPEGLRELFRHAQPTREMTAAEKARTFERIAQLPTTPPAIPPFFAAPKVVGLALVVGGIIGLLAGGHLSTLRDDKPFTPSSVTAPSASSIPSAATPPPPLLPGDGHQGLNDSLRYEENHKNSSDASPVPGQTIPEHTQAIAPTPDEKLANRSRFDTCARPPAPPATTKQHLAPLSPGASSISITVASLPPAIAGPRESEFIEKAHNLLSTVPSDALVVLAEHERVFPQGVLTKEREFLAVQALKALGRMDEARARGQTLHGSTYETRVRNLLGKTSSNGSD